MNQSRKTTHRRSLPRERHELILSRVRRTGAVRVVDLARELGVSEMTVRRDLDALHDAGLVVKVHGGATIRYPHSTDEPGFEAKSLRNTDEKTFIASSAAALVSAGAAIGITAGTTTVRLAAELVSVPDLTVVTNSVRVAEVFDTSPRSDRTVVITGGVRTPSDALVGPVAVAALRTFHLDQLFMGVHGIHDRAGFTTPNLLEAETNREFAAAADRLIVLADHTKWGVAGLATMAPLEDASVLVTDAGLSDDVFDLLTERIDRVIVSGNDALRAAADDGPRRASSAATSETSH